MNREIKRVIIYTTLRTVGIFSLIFDRRDKEKTEKILPAKHKNSIKDLGI